MPRCMVRHLARFGAGVVAALVLLSATGCAPTYTDYSAFIKEPRPLVTATEYRVAPPDSLTIYSKTVREVSGGAQTIRPDGVITLPLLGDVYVAGKTCAEISEELTAMAATYYEDAEVTVRVSNFASKKIYIFGEVSRPGPHPYHGANRILETMAIAQPTQTADPSRITVLRPNADGELIRRMTVDLDQMVKHGHTNLDAVLEEGDIIWVPPTPLAKVGQAVQQLLLPLRPAASTAQDLTTIENYDGYGR